MPISVMLKPASGNCNLRCEYCFYHDLAATRQTENKGYMTRDTALQVMDKALTFAGDGPVYFTFQGGEPLLAGKDFFRFFFSSCKERQRPGVTVQFCVQTNGTLLDDDLVSHSLKLANDVVGSFLLHFDFLTTDPLPAWRIKRLLRVQVPINHIHNHLNMSLGLHPSAHNSSSLVFRVSDILRVHQFCIAKVYFPAINKCMDSVSCDLLRICDALHGKCFSICFADRVRDRMVGITLAVRCDLQQFFFSDCVVFVRGRLYFRNLKFTLGQCTGLVKHDRCHLGNCL